MDITGLTGQSGCGKTTVALIMKEFGFYHIDCDKLVHEKVYTDGNVLKRISDAFGEEYVSGCTLERRKLGALVFSDKTAYDKLMSIVKEEIIIKVREEISANLDRHILLDAPTLFEFGMEKECDRVIGVISQKAIERITERDGISENQAKNRLKNQKDVEFFRQNCDIIIENDKDLDDLQQRVSEISKQILEGRT